MSFNEKIYPIAISVAASPSLNRVWNDIAHQTPDAIYHRMSDGGEIDTQEFISNRYSGKPLEVAQRIYDFALEHSIDIIDFWDARYPPLLREIYRPPIVLYCRGNFVAERPIAVVGTRKGDRISSMITQRIARELSTAGFTIVSGMAIGVDRDAHLGALHTGKSTIGVLANGIGVVYPSANRDLYNAIVSSGCSSLLSEYPPGIFAGRWTFVRRNRIISGLSLGTLVVKAGEKSGALITARYAVEQNREVFACPGHAFEEDYWGCNNLIRSGATVVTCTEDILREFPLFYNLSESSIHDRSQSGKSEDEQCELEFSLVGHKNENAYPDDSVEKKICEVLAKGERDVDTLVRVLKVNAGEANRAITQLEIAGHIERNGNTISRI
jgi:DNA processing protein